MTVESHFFREDSALSEGGRGREQLQLFVVVGGVSGCAIM